MVTIKNKTKSPFKPGKKLENITQFGYRAFNIVAFLFHLWAVSTLQRQFYVHPFGYNKNYF